MDADSLISRARRRLRGGGDGAGAVPTAPDRTAGSSPTPGAASGPKPEVVAETTHYGPAVDRAVERLRHNQGRPGVEPDYDLVRERFDHYHAVLQAPELENRRSTDPIRALLRAGADARFDPEPGFSLRKYLQRHPERRAGDRSPYLAWLTEGRAAGEIADPADGVGPLADVLGMTEDELVAEAVRLRTDMTERLRTGTLGEMFAKAVELEPLIGEAWGETTRTKQLPLRNESVARGAAAIHAVHDEAGLRRARVLIVSDRPGGGGDGFDGVVARALAETIPTDEIVVIHTDQGGAVPEGWFPDGVRTVDLASRLDGVAQGVREQTLVSLVRSFGADAVLNVESRLLYAALAPYGNALAHSERVFLCFFGAGTGPLGTWSGWSLRWLYPSFEYVAGFITDSERVRDGLVEHFQLAPGDAAALHVLRTPARPEIPVATPPGGERRSVVGWQPAGRGRPGLDVVREIARRMPDVEVRLHGVAPSTLRGDVPDNLVAAEARVDVRHTGLDAWLHTAAQEAVAGDLLEIAMTATPIVAARCAGTREVVSAEDSWLVDVPDDAEAYVAALREVLADPGTAATRARALRERLIAERPTPAAQVAELLLRPEGAR